MESKEYILEKIEESQKRSQNLLKELNNMINEL